MKPDIGKNFFKKKEINDSSYEFFTKEFDLSVNAKTLLLKVN